jgi:hypothetical protein
VRDLAGAHVDNLDQVGAQLNPFDFGFRVALLPLELSESLAGLGGGHLQGLLELGHIVGLVHVQFAGQGRQLQRDGRLVIGQPHVIHLRAVLQLDGMLFGVVQDSRDAAFQPMLDLVGIAPDAGGREQLARLRL